MPFPSAAENILTGSTGQEGVVMNERRIVRSMRRVMAAVRGGAPRGLQERTEQLEARLAELEAERVRVRDALAHFGEALAATHDAKQLLPIVAAAAAEATAARSCRIISVDGSVVASGDPGGDGERLTLPLTASNVHFGTLELVGDSFDEEQRLTAASLASHAVVALENARLHRMVEQQALVDSLTGLANRRACSDALQAEAARARRFGTPLSVVLADLDGFKEVNDVHGHAVGDEVLQTFADVLRRTVRDSDVAGRWGGEEFLLLLPGADADGAVQLAERVRAALPARRIADAEGLRVTASFGVAEHRPGSDAEHLLAAADEALYRAKRSGKDRVERGIAEPLLTLSREKIGSTPGIMPPDDEHDPREDA
jgi:diguanylate cyclase (GGDEF)-like protein